MGYNKPVLEHLNIATGISPCSAKKYFFLYSSTSAVKSSQLFFRCVSLWSSETPCIRAAARNIAKAVLHKAGISEALLLPAPPEADEDERDNEEGGDFFDRAAAKNGDNEASGEKIASFWHAFFMRKEDEAILSSSRTKMQKGVFGLFVCAVGLLSSDDTTSNTRITDAWKGAAISHLLKFVAHTGDDDSTHVHSLASCILRCVIYGEEEEEDEEEEEEVVEVEEERGEERNEKNGSKRRRHA